jgi:O-antigen/teichoic acid export membrane protein
VDRPAPTAPGSLAQSAIRGVVWSAAGSVATQILQLGVGILLARRLGPEAFGLVGLAMAVTGLLSIVGEAGLGPAVVQRRGMSPSLLATVFWAGLAVGACQFGLLWIAAPAVAGLLRQPALGQLLRISAFVLLIAPLGVVHRFLLTRELGFKALARIEVLAAVLGGAVAVGLALKGAGVFALVARVLVTVSATAALAWASSSWRPPAGSWQPRQWDIDGLRGLLPFGLGVIGTELLNQVAQNIDFVLIGRYLGAVTLGEYSQAYALATLPQGRLAPVLTRVMFPVFARVQENDATVRRGYTRLVERVALASFPLMALLGLVGPVLLPVVYGQRWRGVVVPLPALCFAGAAYAVATTVGSVYRAKGRSDLELKTTAVRALLLAGFVGAGLAGWGTSRAVALAVALYACTSTLAFQTVVNRLIGLRMREYLAALAPAVFGTALMAGAMVATRFGLANHLAMAPRMITSVAAGTLTYGVFLGAWWVIGHRRISIKKGNEPGHGTAGA